MSERIESLAERLDTDSEFMDAIDEAADALRELDKLTEVQENTITALESERDALKAWAIQAAPFVHRTLHDGHSVDSRKNCHHPLCKEITALGIGYPDDPQPAAEPEPAPELSEYAKRMVEQAAKKPADQREGKQ